MSDTMTECAETYTEVDDGAALLDEVEAFVGRFLALPNEHCLPAIVLWITHTWALDAFYVTPRLVLDSPEPGSGKTRVLEVLALLCREAKLTLSTTTAALYRRIAASDHPPTVLQDEADAVFGKANTPQAEDLRALFNAGYKRGATVDRCEGDAKNMKVREFPVFAPVALAGLAGRMPATITTRSVVIHMRRRTADERVAEFRERDAVAAAVPIRSRLQAWADGHFGALEAARPEMPLGVRDRPAEVWEALVAVADAAGGGWPERARAACKHFVLNSDPDELSLGARLLADVRDVLDEDARVFSADLVEKLKADPESEWADLYGKPLDQRRLAKELRRYGVRSKKVRIGVAEAKGYTVDGDDGLAQAWRRYLPSVGKRSERSRGSIAGQGGTDGTQGTDNRSVRPVSVPTETRPDQQLSTAGTPGTLGTPTSRPNGATPGLTVVRPGGPGRCTSCGFHVATQGHRRGCSKATGPVKPLEAARQLAADAGGTATLDIDTIAKASDATYRLVRKSMNAPKGKRSGVQKSGVDEWTVTA